MKLLGISLGFLMVTTMTFGQGLICIRPDSTSQDTLRVGHSIRISLTSPPDTYRGRLIDLKADSIRVKLDDGFWGSTRPWVALNQVTGLQKTTIFSSSTARFMYNYAFTLGGIVLPRYLFTHYPTWSKTGQLGVNVVSGVLVGSAFYFLSTKLIWPKRMGQRTQRGWRFKFVSN
ncbi:hypothetical protein [Spirosoma pollinicola]|uniref:Uncharacterized protein n=1 Tax=Spirosoma pollinicola TaxID=2057025 RepID=A0A2K8Z9R7_9BACT|nr:hypothetical protein [Spirosoma pollinicola]AUD06612.1 hypothetical protein CWM47_35055 [Spirosoma pollinicola]